MGCTEIGHHHVWPTRGEVVIQQCETYCNFCTGEKAQKAWKYAWFLRRHVRNVHGQGKNADFPKVKVSQYWKKKGNAKKAARAKRIKTRESEEPEDSKVGLAGQKNLPDFMPPPKIDGVDGAGMGDFDEDAAREFGYDNVVHDVLNNPNVLLGADEIDENEPMLSILEHTDMEAFMNRAMMGATHKNTQRMTNGDGEMAADGYDDNNGAFQGYDGIPEEAIDDLAGEFDVAGIDKAADRTDRAAGKAPVRNGDEMLVDGQEVGRNFEYVPAAALHERNTDFPVETSGTLFGWNPDDVPDQFFMSDYPTPPTYFEDRPLADYFDISYPAGPVENNLSMMAMLNTTAEEMRVQGMGNQDMMWAMNQFSHGLAQFGAPTLATGLVFQPRKYEPLVGDESFEPVGQPVRPGQIFQLD